MPSQEILYCVANRVATITLNRPDKLNAWTAVMEKEVSSAMENAERDDDVRVIVLTGAGRGFCAGADMSLLSAVAEHGLAGGPLKPGFGLSGDDHTSQTLLKHLSG
jgi:enoyl-CoA hydratase/carnithine racemase